MKRFAPVAIAAGDSSEWGVAGVGAQASERLDGFQVFTVDIKGTTISPYYSIVIDYGVALAGVCPTQASATYTGEVRVGLEILPVSLVFVDGVTTWADYKTALDTAISGFATATIVGNTIVIQGTEPGDIIIAENDVGLEFFTHDPGFSGVVGASTNVLTPADTGVATISWDGGNGYNETATQNAGTRVSYFEPGVQSIKVDMATEISDVVIFCSSTDQRR